MSTPSVRPDVIKPLLDPALGAKMNPAERQEAAKPLYAHLAQVEAALRDQAQTIDDLNQQVQKLTSAPSEPQTEVADLRQQLERVEKAHADEKQALEEQIGQLRQQLEARPKDEARSDLEGQLQKAEEALRQATTNHEEAIQRMTEELEVLRPKATQVEGLTEAAQREAEKAALAQAKLAIAEQLFNMSLPAVEARLGEISAPKNDLETYEEGLLQSMKARLEEAVEPKVREEQDRAAKREAEFDARSGHELHQATQRQMDEDARLLQIPSDQIPAEIRRQEEMVAAVEEELAKIANGRTQDPDGQIALKATQAKETAEKKIGILNILIKLAQPGEVQENARAFLELAALLQPDMKGMAPFDALKQMVEVLDQLRSRYIKYTSEKQSVPVDGVLDRLDRLLQKHNEFFRYWNALSIVLPDNGSAVVDLPNAIQQVATEISELRDSLAPLSDRAEIARVNQEILELEAKHAVLQQLHRVVQPHLDTLNGTHTGEKTQLEWEKGVIGTMQRMVLSLFAMIWGIPGVLLGGFKTAGSILVKPTK